MSFAAQTKKELTQLVTDSCCRKGELTALIRMNGTFQFGGNRFILNVSTENAAIARHIYVLLKEIFQVHVELLVRKKMRLKKNNVYIVRISHSVREILDQLGIMKGGAFNYGISQDIIKNDCCKRAYLRGAFLAGGSVNHPEASSYHLEIFSSHQEHCLQLTELANHYQLNARYIERKKGHIMYIKEGEKISDFLGIIGAHQALMFFEDVRIVKDLKNSANRLNNCDMANLNKTVMAAMKQIENILLIDEKIGLETLPKRLRDVAELRLKYRDMNLAELGDYLPEGKVSKSGINHRMRKIGEIADKLREKEGKLTD